MSLLIKLAERIFVSHFSTNRRKDKSFFSPLLIHSSWRSKRITIFGTDYSRRIFSIFFSLSPVKMDRCISFHGKSSISSSGSEIWDFHFLKDQTKFHSTQKKKKGHTFSNQKKKHYLIPKHEVWYAKKEHHVASFEFWNWRRRGKWHITKPPYW